MKIKYHWSISVTDDYLFYYYKKISNKITDKRYDKKGIHDDKKLLFIKQTNDCSNVFNNNDAEIRVCWENKC